MELNNNITSDTIIKLTNCNLLCGNQLVDDYLLIRSGKILDGKKLFFDEHTPADITIDCHGSIISPGFIDVQVNGGYGVDFSSPDTSSTSRGLETVARALLGQGVTSFCPTVITSAPETYRQLLPELRLPLPPTVAQSLGIHIEGPFISREKRGMHPPDLTLPFLNGEPCSSPWDEVMRVYGSLEGVAMLTLAPEIPGSSDVIKELVKRGIRVCLGHSMASLEEGEEAVMAGATLITHLFSSMLPFHHRDPHLVGLLTSAQLAGKEVYFGLIADLLHTHSAALRIAHRTHPSGLMLVTDSNLALGLPDGEYHFGERLIDVRQGCSYTKDTDTLAGATAPLDRCVRNFWKSTDVSVAQALLTVTDHPARALGIQDRKGTLLPGTDADFVLLSASLDVLSTWINGKVVYASDEYRLTVI